MTNDHKRKQVLSSGTSPGFLKTQATLATLSAQQVESQLLTEPVRRQSGGSEPESPVSLLSTNMTAVS